MAEKEYIDLETAYDMDTLEDWYINSVSDNDTPVWTEEHLEELLNDFYVIPKDTPAADVEPVRHGHWIRPDVPNTRSYKWQCSECGQTAYWLHYGNRGNKNIICKYSYCPNCGAKMDGDTNGS